jgi:cell division protein FtsW
MAYIGCHIRAISKVALPVVWILLLYTLVKGTVIAGLPVGGFRCLYVIPDVNIGICTILSLSKTRKWQLILSLLYGIWLPVFTH